MTSLSSMALRVDGEGVWVLDQTQLPLKEEWLRSPTVDSMMSIIRELRVRGAPLIGVAAAAQVGWLAGRGASVDELNQALVQLRAVRPTAVNLMHAMDRCAQALRTGGPRALIEAAEDLWHEDVRLCQAMATHGAGLIEDGDRVLTHCNTGGLATVGVGTALGAITQAARAGKKLHVYVDETRPLLQGGRLTTWELARANVPYTLVCDNMAASLMQQGLVSRVFVGADRIARNGDFANKVGTYGLAVLCRFHSVPFYVVAPRTTVDRECAHGEAIVIEERSADEVRGVAGAFGRVRWAPPESEVWNPAFDVTPESLVTAWVLDHGIFDRTDIRNGILAEV